MNRRLLAALLAAGALATAPAIAQQPPQNGQQTQQKETVPLQLTNQQVMQVQQKLHQQNLYTGATDGQWGPETRAAVENFQKKHSLPATGKLDAQTLAQLGINLSSGGAAITGYGSSQMPQNSGGGAALGYGSSQTPQNSGGASGYGSTPGSQR